MDILETITSRLGVQFDRAGRAHATCPECGADSHNRTGHAAYHFYVYDLPSGARGAICQVCGYKPSLIELARRLGAVDYTPAKPREYVAPPVAPWIGDQALASYRAYQMRHWDQLVAAWQQYKPVSVDTISANDLGYGRLPFYSEERQCWYPGKYDRLILPIMEHGRIIGLRGRAIHADDTAAKWMTASHSQSTLMGIDRVVPGSMVIWCENLIDRLIAYQVNPSAVYVASGGVSWRREWIAELATRKPKRVIVWFDNDMAGCPNATIQRAAVAKWRQSNRATPLPEPRGITLANELLAAGIQASIYRWSNQSPEHADLGWLLAQRKDIP